MSALITPNIDLAVKFRMSLWSESTTRKGDSENVFTQPRDELKFVFPTCKHSAFFS